MQMSEKLIVYGTPTCPMVPPVLGTLQRAKVEHDYVNIQRDPEAYERVMEINGGFASVPTLVFPDGKTLTEPSARELIEALEIRGVSISGGKTFFRLQHPAIIIVGGVFLSIGLIQRDTLQTVLGAILLLVAFGVRMLRSR